jgi:DNA-binding beta-propeller fold protein YncE
MTRLLRLAAPVYALLSCAVALGQSTFQPFESPQTHPADVSPDGTRLAVVHSSDQRVGIYALEDPTAPVLLREIPVGLEPVSLRFRNDDELWVVNWLSDSVSVVSISQQAVVATLQVPDEPADVVFAGNPERAFVSATAKDAILVFDPLTRALVRTIDFPSKDPRALAVNRARTRVLALSARSGNGTTVVPQALSPAPPPPTRPGLPLAPPQSILVRADDPTWSAVVNITLPDEDLIEIDAQSFAIVRRVAAIGTTNFDLAVHPSSGDVFVANTDARNLVRFEPALRGHSIDSRVTRVSAAGAVLHFDLNPTVSYTQLPDPAGAALALAEPTGIVFDASTDKLYVAAQGTDRIGVLSTAGALLARIELGVAGAASNARVKKGPRAMALHPTAPVLYVVQRLASSVAVIDTRTDAVLREVAFPYDPMPARWKAGRGFLYDAKLSGNGTMSCAACHIDAEMDGIGWDLGDPGGVLQNPPAGQSAPFNQFLTPFHPMKGSMTTQTLRGMRGQQPLHWRGDRADIDDFNGAFASLLGGPLLGATDLADFKAFVLEIPFPPNPNQQRDRSFATFPIAANAATGASTFQNFTITGGTFFPALRCSTCHALPSGSNRQVLSLQVANNQNDLQMKVPHLRNVYRKLGLRRGAVSKSGFGLHHDGSIDTLASLLALGAFQSWPTNLKDDLEQFVLAFDTGTAPTVGWQRFSDHTNATSPILTADLNLLEAEAVAADCDLIAKGRLDGEDLGFHFEPATRRYRASRAALGTFARGDLLAHVQARRASYVFTGVPVSAGRRMGIDRDADGVLDGDEGLLAYGSGTPGCGFQLRTNGPAQLGFRGFAFVVESAPPLVPGVLFVSLSRASIPVFGTELLVDPFSPVFLNVILTTDFRGIALAPFPLLRNPLLDGLTIDVQALFPSTCAPQGLGLSAGLEVTLHR